MTLRNNGKKCLEGFTLIELLAVIVILAIVALVATPIVLNVIEGTREKADLSSAYGVVDTARLHYIQKTAEEETLPIYNIVGELTIAGEQLDINENDVRVNRVGEVAVSLHYNDNCYMKGFNDSKISVIPYDVSTCKITFPATTIEAPKNGSVYVDSNGDEAPIPYEFMVSSSSSEQIIDDGLVIVDKYGNEFVWIPVELAVKADGYEYLDEDYPKVAYTRFLSSSEIAYDNVVSDTLPTGVSSETAQIEKYHGFYIARYEATFDYNGGSFRMASKAGDIEEGETSFYWPAADSDVFSEFLWNNIGYGDAKQYAENMANAYGYHSSIKTGMVNGRQWDTILRFINVSDSPDFMAIYDSRSWGNYSDSISPANSPEDMFGQIQNTGVNDNWKKQNIYDIAGNLKEWTSEKESSTNYYVIRSNGYNGSGGSDGSASFATSSASYAFNEVGFRAVLYID